MLIRNTLLYLPAQVAGPGAQFVAIVVFTHWLSPESYGLFSYVLASQDFVFLLCLSWWSQYTVRYLGDHEAASVDTYHRSETTILALTIVLQAAAVLLALRLIAEATTLRLALSAILYTVTRCLTLHLGERARARNRFLDYTVAQSGGPVIGFAVAFVAVVRIAATPDVALLGYSAAQAIILVWLVARQEIDCVPRRPDRRLLREALTFGLPLIGAGLAAWFGLNAIRILIDQKMGATAMGLVAVGWGLGLRLTATAVMLVTVAAYPLAVESLRKGSREHALSQITANGLLMFALVLPAAVGLFMLQGPVISLLVADPFRETTLAVLPAALAAGLFRNIRTHVVEQAFTLVARTRTVLVLSCIETALVVAGCIVGLDAGGAAGATWGAAAGYGIALVISFTAARYSVGLRMPWRDMGAVALAAAVMALVLDAVMQAPWPGGPAMRIAILVLVGIIVYGVGVMALFPVLSRWAWKQWRQVVAQ